MKHFIAAVWLMLLASCQVLGPPNTFKSSMALDLTHTVADRTADYVEADESLTDEQEADRLAALESATDYLESIENASRTQYRALTEGPFAWHDAYVSGDASVPVHKQARWLRSTDILRTTYWSK